MVDRVAGWRNRYNTLMLESATHPFKWFEHDCVTFAAKALDAQYEIGVMAYIEANYFYNDADSARAIIEKAGGLESLVSQVLGISAVPPAFLTVGDIAIVDYNQDGFAQALAVHDGHQLLVPAAHGLTYLNLVRSLKGWSP